VTRSLLLHAPQKDPLRRLFQCQNNDVANEALTQKVSLPVWKSICRWNTVNWSANWALLLLLLLSLPEDLCAWNLAFGIMRAAHRIAPTAISLQRYSMVVVCYVVVDFLRVN
jgi:hypothetical protein